jgi:hypothetical protein
MRVIKMTEALSGIGVVIGVTLMLHFIFGKTWSESGGLGFTVGLASIVTQLGIRRAREKRIAGQSIGMRVRVLLSAGVLLVIVKFGLDLSGAGSAGMRAVLGVIALMLLLLGAVEVARKAAPSR